MYLIQSQRAFKELRIQERSVIPLNPLSLALSPGSALALGPNPQCDSLKTRSLKTPQGSQGHAGPFKALKSLMKYTWVAMVLKKYVLFKGPIRALRGP